MDNTIYSRFAGMVEQHPDIPAIIEESRTVSYRDLDRLVDRISGKFAETRDPFIGIVMSHGIEMIAAILAVLKSGAAYVPAEPSLPEDRINYMMKCAGVRLVITDGYCRDLPAAKVQPDRSSADGAAYVLYTSGTSGRPKGVIVENRSVVNYAEAFEAEFHTAPGDVMLQYSVCAFDIFVEEVFTTLLNGATLAIPPKEIREGGIEELMDFCERHGVTEISGFPYLLADMNRHKRYPSRLRLLISGGDVVRESYITWLKKQGFVIYNTYGPSETTVCATFYRIDNSPALDDGTYPVGKPVKGVEVMILDKNLREVPDGETGEICISGKGVARSYLCDPPEQSNFITRQDGSRMYRSGDLGYKLPDGNIAFLHRKDRQVMILGKRVEPDEVENILNESPCVERGIVRAFADEQGLAYLTAYIVLSHKYCKVSDIRRFLASRLADYMIPEYFVRMEELPLTPRGKIDNHALPIVNEGRRDSMRINIIPLTDIDRLMAWRREVIAEVFSTDPSDKLLAANRRYYETHLANGSHMAFIAETDGTETGCGAICLSDELPSPDNPSGHCAYLMNIYVRKPYRSRGIGHAIVSYLVETAIKSGCDKIYLETTPEARSLYEETGFTELPGILKYADIRNRQS